MLVLSLKVAIPLEALTQSVGIQHTSIKSLPRQIATFPAMLPLVSSSFQRLGTLKQVSPTRSKERRSAGVSKTPDHGKAGRHAETPHKANQDVSAEARRNVEPPGDGWHRVDALGAAQEAPKARPARSQSAKKFSEAWKDRIRITCRVSRLPHRELDYYEPH